MDYLRLEGDRISKYAICQAHRQLEEDYGVNSFGKPQVLLQRRSNVRRKQPTRMQLQRMKMINSLWVDVVADPKKNQPILMEQVRFVYLLNILKLGLPHDKQLRCTMRRMLNHSWLVQNYPEILRTEVAGEANCTKHKHSPMFIKATLMVGFSRQLKSQSLRFKNT